MAAIVDVQGFKDQYNKFIVKELAILTNDGKAQHLIFQPPFAFNDLTPAKRREVFWLKHNFHGFSWNDGLIPYHQIYHLLPQLISDKTIYVKGLEKSKWLKDLLGADINVYDVETELQCPKLSWLRFKKDNICCLMHSGQCALRNVFLIRDFLVNRNSVQ